MSPLTMDSTSTMVQAMKHRPSDSPAIVLKDYLNRMPDRTFRYSYVFHGIQGCELPTQMRADTCNNYEYDLLVNVRQ